MNYPNLLTKRPFLGLLLALVFATAAFPVYCQTPVPKEEKLLNGLRLLMFDAPGGDKVTLKVRIHSGSAFDPQGKEGVMKLLAANIFPNAEAKEYFADQLGGSLDVESSYDYIQINASSRPDKVVNMIETVANAIAGIEIDKETTAKLKDAQLKRIAELSGNPAYVADQAAAARLLGTFPYGRPADGTVDTIGKIDFADLLAAKQRFFTADNAVVAISGSFDQATAFRAVRRYFGAWLKADKLVPSTFRQPDDPPLGVQMIDSPVANKFEMRFVTRGTTRSSNDFAAYAVASKIVENRLRALIPDGAIGSVSAVSEDHVLPGTLVIRFSGTKDASIPKVEANDILPKVLSMPVSEKEFQTAKQAFTSFLDKQDIVDRWLDSITFRTEPPAKFYSRAAATSLGDVQNVLSRLQKQPFASVVVSSAKGSN